MPPNRPTAAMGGGVRGGGSGQLRSSGSIRSIVSIGQLTTMRLMETQQSSGKSCSIGTRNCRQPSQWHSSSIMPMRLKILTTALARSYVMWKIWGRGEELQRKTPPSYGS